MNKNKLLSLVLFVALLLVPWRVNAQTPIFEEDFEGYSENGATPETWIDSDYTNYETEDENYCAWLINQGSGDIGSEENKTNSAACWLYSGSRKFYLPYITIPQGNTVTLSFKCAANLYGSIVSLDVYYNQVSNETKINQESIVLGQSVWRDYSFVLPVETWNENIQLIFVPASNNDGFIAIDDIVVAEAAGGNSEPEDPDFITLFGCDFEDDNSGWNFLTGSGNNQFVIGNGTSNGGSKALYVSNDGSSYAYSLSSQSKSFAYVEVDLEQGATYTLSYDWKCEGENNYWDVGRVYLTSVMSDISTSLTINGSWVSNGPKSAIFLNDGYLSEGYHFMSTQTEWVSYSSGDFTVPSTGKYYLVVAWENDNSGGSQKPVAVDNIKLMGPPASCGQASAALAFRTETTATLNITSTTEQVEFAWGTAGQAIDELVPETIAAGEKTVSGLTSGSLYVVYVRPVCDGKKSWTSVEFAAASPAVSTLPYSQDFEGALENLGWTIVGSGDNQLTIDEFGGRSALYITNNGENKYDPAKASTSVAYRAIELKAGQMYKVEYEWINYGQSNTHSDFWSYAYPAVYLTNDPAELAATYNHREVAPAKSINNELMVNEHNWTSYIKEGVTVNADGIYYIAVAWQNSKSDLASTDTYSPYFGLDNLTISELDCYDVEIPEYNDLFVADVTASFRVNTSAPSVEVRYGVPGATFEECAATAVEVTVVEGRVTIEGLTPNTAYVAYVRSACGDKFGVPSSISFTTVKTPANAPYMYDFDNDNDAAANWTLVDGKFVVGTENAVSGNGLYVSDEALANRGVYTAYRTINLTAGTYVVEYDWKAEGMVWTNVGSISLASELNGNSVFSANNLCEQAEWTHYRNINVEVHEDGLYYLIVKWQVNDASDHSTPIAVDNIIIREVACENVTIYNNGVTSESVTLGFSTDETVDIRIGLKGEDVNVCDVVVENHALVNYQYVVSDLTDATEYVVYVRTVCDVDHVGEWNSVEFKTATLPATLPYSYNFEDGSDDRNWTLTVRVENKPNGFVVGSDADAQPAGSTRSLYITSDGSEYGYVKGNYSQNYALRGVTLEANVPYSISFDWKNVGMYYDYVNYSRDYMRVFLINNGNTSDYNLNYNNTDISYNYTGTDKWVCLDGGNALLGQADWTTFTSEEITVPVSGIYYLVFAWRNDYSGDPTAPAAIDNIEIKAVTCVKPTVTDIATDENSAKFTFVGVAEGMTYELEYKATGEQESATVVIENPSEPYVLTGLTEKTAYEGTVRAVCGEGEYSNAAEVAFTTTAKPLSVPFVTGFEDDVENAKWKFVDNDNTNKFMIGAGIQNGGSNALYVSNNGADYAYNNGVPSYSFAYILVRLEAGEEYNIKYDWQCDGEGNWDFARAFITRDAGYIAPTTDIRNNSLPSDAIELDEGKMQLNTVWTTYTKEGLTVQETGVYYVVFGWTNDGSMGSGKPVAVDNFEITKVGAEPSVYTISYVVDGVVSYTADIAEGMEIPSIEAPEKEGYTFAGWDGLPAVMPAENLTVTAQFTVNSYTVTYKVDGEVYGEVETVAYGTELVARDVPEAREGYTFSGWSTVPETMPANDVVIEGTFNVNSYTITYIVDDEQYGDVVEVEFGAEITYEVAPEKEGYTFSGWSIEGYEDLPETMPAENLVIKGSFTKDHGPVAVDNVTAKALTVAPNPVAVGDVAYITGNFAAEDVVAIEVYNAAGSLVQADNAPEAPLAVSGLTARGVYFVRVITADGNVLTGKLVVK